MRVVLVAEPRAGASYVLQCLQDEYADVHLVTDITQPIEYYRWLLEDSKVIWLRRKDKTNQLISFLIAENFNQHLTEEFKNRLTEVIPRVTPSDENVDEFYSRIRCVNLLYKEFSHPTHTEIYYEDLLMHGELHPYKIKEQLGIKVKRMPPYIKTPYKRARELYIKDYELSTKIKS